MLTYLGAGFKSRRDRNPEVLEFLDELHLLTYVTQPIPWDVDAFHREREALWGRCKEFYLHRDVGCLRPAESTFFEKTEGAWPERCKATYEWALKRLRDEYKGRFTAWSPTAYKVDPETGSCLPRKDANVDYLTALVFDYDKGVRYAEIRALWECLGVTFAMHTSPSHVHTGPDDESKDRLRVIIPFASACPPEKFKLVWRWGYHYTNCTADEKASDPSRIYYRNYQPFDSDTRGMACIIRGFHLLNWEDLPLDVFKDKPKAPPKFKKMLLPSRSNDDKFKCPENRRQLGLALGGHDTGKAIRGALCPACGDHSLWWWISPDGALKATCNHLDSCQQSFWLDQLEIK